MKHKWTVEKTTIRAAHSGSTQQCSDTTEPLETNHWKLSRGGAIRGAGGTTEFVGVVVRPPQPPGEAINTPPSTASMKSSDSCGGGCVSASEEMVSREETVVAAEAARSWDTWYVSVSCRWVHKARTRTYYYGIHVLTPTRNRRALTMEDGGVWRPLAHLLQTLDIAARVPCSTGTEPRIWRAWWTHTSVIPDRIHPRRHCLLVLAAAVT